MEKVVFFLDYANISRAAREKRYRLDYHDLLQYIGENRFLIDAHCYVPINPRQEHRSDGEIEELWRSGYIVNTKRGTIAAFEDASGPDILLKCSGFIDLAVYYESYLAAQNSEQAEASVEQQYKDLIQLQEVDLNEADIKLPVESEESEESVPVPDDIEEMNL
jgi:hypothetical protein